MNSLIGKKVMFQKPFIDNSGVIYARIGKAGEIVDFTEDLLQVLIVEELSGELFVVPIEDVRVLKEFKNEEIT